MQPTSISTASMPAAAPRDARRVDDSWEGLSRDLIERFIDVTCVERALSRTARRGYRADLVALDLWMHETRGRTLVSARGTELRAYFSERMGEGLEPRLLDRLLVSVHHFYQYANESGCRDDNPAKRLPLWFSKSARSLIDLATSLPSRAHC